MNDNQGLIHAFFNDESGQAFFEYIFLLSLAVMMAAFFANVVLGAFDDGILKFGSKFEKYLKTGRMPPDVWTN